MACMEHICIQQKCGWYVIDNQSHKCCPRCGGPVRSYFDEEGNLYYDDDEENEICENLNS